VDNVITPKILGDILPRPWRKPSGFRCLGWVADCSYKDKRGYYNKIRYIPGLLLGRFMTSDYPSTWHLSDPSWTDKRKPWPEPSREIPPKTGEPNAAAGHTVDWCGPPGPWSKDPQGILSGDPFTPGSEDRCPVSWTDKSRYDIVALWTNATSADITVKHVPTCERCHGTGLGYPVAHGPFEANGRTTFIVRQDPCKACSSDVQRQEQARRESDVVYAMRLRVAAQRHMYAHGPTWTQPPEIQAALADRVLRLGPGIYSGIDFGVGQDTGVTVSYRTGVATVRGLTPEAHNIPPPKSSGIRGPGHADAFKPVLYDTRALEAYIQKTVLDAMHSPTKPIPYSDAGFPVLRDAFVRTWQGLTDDQRAWYGEVDDAAQALVSGHATPEQTALLSDGLARSADPERIAAVFTQSTPWCVAEFDAARQLAHEQARETARLKSAAEAQWDADVSAWGFTPEPRSKRRAPSPNNPLEFGPDDPLFFSAGPRVRDFPPRAFAAICQALRDRDPSIIQAIRGVPGSMYRDPYLSVTEWVLCARIHSGVLARTSFETANIPRRLIRLGVAEQLPDSGGLEWGFTPAMARILDAWVQPAQTFGPDRLEGA
jgi:hypothetical protein